MQGKLKLKEVEYTAPDHTRSTDTRAGPHLFAQCVLCHPLCPWPWKGNPSIFTCIANYPPASRSTCHYPFEEVDISMAASMRQACSRTHCLKIQPPKLDFLSSSPGLPSTSHVTLNNQLVPSFFNFVQLFEV